MAFSISGEKIFEIFGFEVTNTLFLSFLVSFSLALFLFFIFKKEKLIPDKAQNFFELIFEAFLNLFDSITGSREKTKKIFPLALTLFLFILFCNLLGTIPGQGIFKFLRSPSSDLNFALALAIFSMLYVNYLALKDLGILNYLKRFFSKNPIYLPLGFLEFISEITRTLSLALRLYGNLLGGKILLMVSFFSFPFLFFEIFVSFIQAFIFSFLIVVFYLAASRIHEER